MTLPRCSLPPRIRDAAARTPFLAMAAFAIFVQAAALCSAEGEEGAAAASGEIAARRVAILQEIVAEQDRRIAELEDRVFRLEKARAVPYREVSYRVVNGQFVVTGRYGRFELRVPR